MCLAAPMRASCAQAEEASSVYRAEGDAVSCIGCLRSSAPSHSTRTQLVGDARSWRRSFNYLVCVVGSGPIEREARRGEA